MKRFLLFMLLSGILFWISCKSRPQQTKIPPRLIEPIQFASLTVSNTTPEAASKLMDEKIKSFGEYFDVLGEQMFARDGYDFLVNTNGKRIRTETVNQYKAVSESAYPGTTQDMLARDLMRSVQSKLEFMAKAKPSKQTFLGTNYFLQLSASILSGSVSGDQDEELKKATAGKTVQEFMRPGKLHVEHVTYGTNSMRFKETVNGYGYWVREWARGDVNGDGLEDALVSVGTQTEGTLGWTEVYVVTRIGKDGAVTFVKPDTSTN